MEKIKILKKNVGGNFEKEDMDHSLESMQEIVGGYIEAFSLPMGITMWLDEEGLLKEKKPNIVIKYNGEISSVIAGDAFFTGIDDSGETISLTEEQVNWIKDNISPIGIAKREDTNEQHILFGIEL